jgi:hypothetical protein
MPTVLQTATAQVGLCTMTCGDARGVESTAALHPTYVPYASDQAQNPHYQLGKSVALLASYLPESVICGDHDGLSASDRDYPRVLLPSSTQHVRGSGGQRGSFTRLAPSRRLLALNAVIWFNWQIGAPVKRFLIAYDH